MGNYCCIASKHHQHKSSIRKLQKGKSINKYIDSDIIKHKSSLYNADFPTKPSRGSHHHHNSRSGDLLNGIDSTSSLLLLSSSSTTSSSLNEPPPLARRDNSQIINHLSNKSHTITQSASSKSKSQYSSAVKFNQALIESPLVMHSRRDTDDSVDTHLLKCPQRNDLYNINENEDCDELEDNLKRNTDLNTPNVNSASNTSTSLLLTKSVNSKKLSQRKRSSYLNQSLNETDRDLMKNYNYVGRRLLDDSLVADEDLNESVHNIEHKKQQTTTEALNLFNWKNYRSLQKSKRSIKNLEETIHSSRSIEQWLNDFSKLKLFGDKHKDNHKSLNSITNSSNNNNNKQDEKLGDQKRKISNANQKHKRSRTSLDENDEKYLEEEEINEKESKKVSLDSDDDEFESLIRCSDSSLNQLLNELEKLWRKNSSSQVFKLVDSIKQRLKLKDTMSANEKDMSSRLSELMLPRSLANSDDIDLLKWLLTNFRLKLVGFDTELTYSSDHLVYGTQTNADYLLIANRLNIKLDDQVQAQDQDLDLVVEHLIEKLDSMKTTRLDEDLNVYFKYDPLSGQLKLEKNLVEKLLNKEKEIVNKLSQLNSSILLQDALISSSSTSTSTTTTSSASNESLTKQQQESLNILDKYKKFILETPNFKGAQHLMNIKKKQILNQKSFHTPSSALSSSTNRTNLSSQKVNLNKNTKKSSSKSKQTRLIMKSSTNEPYLTPTPLVCTPISDNSSGTTSPSSSSVSPASSLSSSSYNNNNTNNHTNINDKQSIPISNPTPQTISSSSSSASSTPASSGILLMASQTPTHTANSLSQHDYSITHNDLNERLFSCLLSNFSCKLVDQFLATQLNTGFIRKHKQNKSFHYITIRNNVNEAELMNESAGSGSHTDKINRLDLSIEKQLIQLCLRLNAWPQAYQEAYFKRKRINLKWPTRQVLDFVEKKTCLITSTSSDQSSWQVNTKLAEAYLFKSLPELKQFQFYFLYFVLMNVQVHLSDATKQLVNNKCSKLSMSQLVSERMLVHHFMRFVEIENEDDTNSNKQTNQCFINMVNSVKKFLNYMKFVLDKYKTFNAPNLFDLNQSILNHAEYVTFLNKTISNNSNEDDLFKLISNDLADALNQFDTVLNNSLIVKLNTKKSSLTNNVNLFNSFLDLIQFKLSNNDLEMYYLPAHYSAENYLYEYVYEFVAALFEQFKSKRDNFQISEQLMMELHDSILASKKMFLEESNQDEDNHFLNAIQHVNRDCLFEKFEEYAECVHKYLPQIRHNHQYLLFHYIWTMQVQYMAPFFNYLCDFYSIID